MSVFTTAHCLPPHRLHGEPQPIAPADALAHISKYLADTESSPHLHPDCRFNEHGPTLEGRPPDGGLVLHQLGRVARGLKGERLGEERVVFDSEGVESAVDLEVEMGGPTKSDDRALNHAILKSAMKPNGTTSQQMNGDAVLSSNMDVDLPVEEELVEKSYNQQMREQGEKGNVEDELGARHPKVIENASVPEIKATDGPVAEAKKAKKRKRDSIGQDSTENHHEAVKQAPEQQPQKKTNTTALPPKIVDAVEEERARKRARKEAKRAQKAAEAEKAIDKINGNDQGRAVKKQQDQPTLAANDDVTIAEVVSPVSKLIVPETKGIVNGEPALPANEEAEKQARKEARRALERESASHDEKSDTKSKAGNNAPELSTDGKKKKKQKSKPEVVAVAKPSPLATSPTPIVSAPATNGDARGTHEKSKKAKKTHQTATDESQKVLKDKPQNAMSNTAAPRAASGKSQKKSKDKPIQLAEENIEQPIESKSDKAVKNENHKNGKTDVGRGRDPKAMDSIAKAVTEEDRLAYELPRSKATALPKPNAGGLEVKRKRSNSERRADHRKRQRTSSSEAASAPAIEKEQPPKKKTKHGKHESEAMDAAPPKLAVVQDARKSSSKKKETKADVSETQAGDIGPAKHDHRKSKPKSSDHTIEMDSKKKIESKPRSPAPVASTKDKPKHVDIGSHDKKSKNKSKGGETEKEIKKARKQKRHELKKVHQKEDRMKHHTANQERTKAPKKGD